MPSLIIADQENHLLISSHSLTIKDRTFSIDSLQLAKIQVKRRELGLFSHVLILASGTASVIGLIDFLGLYEWCTWVGYFLVFLAWMGIHEKYLQISYLVTVVSHSAEEVEVLNTKDHKYADQIESEINQAIKATRMSNGLHLRSL